MEPHPDPVLVARLGALVREAARAPAALAEWSQVATAHAGRIYVDGDRRPLPEPAVEVFRRLREEMRDETHGAWFSAQLELGPGGEKFTPNYTERVYWNGARMLEPPADQSPIPTDADWAAELRRHPRVVVPEWIDTPADSHEEFASLRAGLERMGLPRAAVRLPGEDHVTFEGAVLVRQLPGAYTVDVFDYGQLHHIGTDPTARGAGLLAWNYLSSPLPAPVAMPPEELEQRARSGAPGYAQLAARLQAAGPGGVVINLATGIPFDRWGGIDGLYLYAWNTPLPQRSLPPSATEDGATRVTFLANHPVPVQAEVVPAWFDQPGGGIRFRVDEPLRDLLRSGALSVVAATV